MQTVSACPWQADQEGVSTMHVVRRWTEPNVNPLDQVEYEKRSSKITDPDGSVVFEMDEVEVPVGWSQLATDIVVSKYFRKAGVPGNGSETSVRQVVTRVARTIREAGEALGGYFDTPEDADAFEAELSFLLVEQHGAFNSPVWFNCGLYQRYGIEGSGGNWFWDDEHGEIRQVTNAYEHPQCSACFIQGIRDDLMSIFDLIKSEARVFKYGSGTGTNFSRLRSSQEKLSGGGTSSGLMSFLEVFDRAAGATKSGGTTRRAAKMAVLDMDHPEIESFIDWKMKEESKARALIRSGYPEDFNGEAYHTISGQNSNNSVRVTDEFMRAVLSDGAWETRSRTDGSIHKTYKARDLMRKISEAAWFCADPGLQYDTTINDWHTCAATDRIYASNPCSEFVFLDDTACNLASINLMKYLDREGSFDTEGFRHACRIFFLAQEILVDFSSYPTRLIAQNSHDYRPLGLGYANLGTLLMVQGLAYDSDRARATAAAISAILTGAAYRTSADMARSKGAFPAFEANRETMLRVMRKHSDAAYAIDPSHCPPDLLAAAHQEWDDCLKAGEKHGYRNAQATVLAPTGTIGLLMDCDTTGVEPDFALVKFKKLAGGGHFKIVNESVSRALEALGYSEDEVREIVTYARGQQSLSGAPFVNRDSLMDRGLTASEVERVQQALPAALNLAGAFNRRVLGDDCLRRLGFQPEAPPSGDHFLAALGFTSAQVQEADEVICGAMTLEGAPHLKEEHLAVFDCANRCGPNGVRFIEPMGHVRMMAAVQPFLSGAISKTVNLPREATVEDVQEIYVEGWKAGLKAIALYRDGCKQSQPLSTTSGKTGSLAKVKMDRAASGPPSLEPLAAGPELIRHRRRLPKKRLGFTQEARVGGQKIYLRTGEYENGQLGEIFVDMAKEGAAYRSLMNCFAISVSLGLQYGVPLEEYVDVFTFTRFEPHGPVTDHPNIKFATSVMDYVFRVLGFEYLGRTDFLQVKPGEPRSTSDAIADTLGPEPGRETQADGAPGAAPGGRAQPDPGAAPHRKDRERSRPPAGGGLDLSSMAAAVLAAERDSVVRAEVSPAAGTASGGPVDNALTAQMQSLMGDAPFCDICGHLTVRNGACYKCMNCGNSLGCS
ncbi:MAG: vitamin B12-dependent ribonucleotide reductase [Acidobacteriota bacterium]